jgi:capsular polysaccharide biosynthesis protein
VNDETVRLSMVGQVFRRRWRLLIVFAIVGAIAGAGASLLLSPGYEASANVVLQGTRAADELETETQVATSSVVLGRTADALHWGISGADLEKSVTAAVADGNVIAVTADADSPDRAQQLADRVAQEYVAFSTELAADTADASATLRQEQQDALRDQIKQTNALITQLHNAAGGRSVESVQARTQLEAVRSALNESMTALTESESSSSLTKLVVMGPAERPTDKAAPTLLQLALGGALLAVLVGVFAHLMAARRDRRLHTDADIGSALGTTVLGSVTVPHEDNAETSGSGPRRRALLRWLLQQDKPWLVEQLSVAESDRDHAVRYRRAVSRLRDGSGSETTRTSTLVLVADDDPDALAGVAQLAVSAAAGGDPTEVVTDIPAFADVVERLGTPGPRPVIRASADPRPATRRTVLQLAELSAAMPTVPDASDTTGVVLVTTAGTRTQWELFGLTQACVDAGRRLLGAVIVHRSRPAADKTTESGPPSVPVTHNAMAGTR